MRTCTEDHTTVIFLYPVLTCLVCNLSVDKYYTTFTTYTVVPQYQLFRALEEF